MSKRQGPAGPGDNDPALRAEQISAAIAEILAVKADKAAAMEKFKRRHDKAAAVFKGMGMKMADLSMVLRAAELQDTAENAEKAEDREKAAASLKIMIATFVEGYAAVTKTAQLDFDEMLEDGAEARRKEFSTPAGKTTVKGGAPAADTAAKPN